MISPIGNKKTGFVLLELIVVVFIIGTFSLLALPGFRKFSREISLERASRNLRQTIHFAHFRSISEGKNYRIFFDLGKGSFRLEKNSGNGRDFEKITTSLIKERKLVRNVEFLKIITPRGEKRFMDKTYLDFKPDGSSEDCLIYLENKEKKINTIAVKAPTSRVIIYNYEYKE